MLTVLLQVFLESELYLGYKHQQELSETPHYN